MNKTSHYKISRGLFGRTIFHVVTRLRRNPTIKTSDLQRGGAAVIDNLLDCGYLSVAQHATRLLHAAFPSLAFARNLCAIFDRIPPRPHSALKDDPTKDVQIVAKNSDVVVLLFCGGNGAEAPIHPFRLGLPLPLIHRWLARLPASLIYLRDLENVYYLNGVRTLGPSREATLTQMRRIIGSLNARRIVCYGVSAGGFAALDFGLELDADAVLCMGGMTNVSPEFNEHTMRKKKSVAVQSRFRDARLDMLEAYSNAARPPRVRLVYGQNNWDDRIQAEHMAGLSSVTLHAIKNCKEHNVTVPAIIRGEFDGLLDWLVRASKERSFSQRHGDSAKPALVNDAPRC
jgi:hypothetical protein